MKRKLGHVLKESRENSGLTVKQVSDILVESGHKAAIKTIYGWENGYSEPPADTLIALCDIYGIDDILSAFGYTKNTPAQGEGAAGTINTDPRLQELQGYYELLSDMGKNTLVGTARAILDNDNLVELPFVARNGASGSIYVDKKEADRLSKVIEKAKLNPLSDDDL